MIILWNATRREQEFQHVSIDFRSALEVRVCFIRGLLFGLVNRTMMQGRRSFMRRILQFPPLCFRFLWRRL